MFKSPTIFLCLIAAFVLIYDHPKVASAARLQKREGTKYTTRFDNIDVQSILKSSRLLRSYVNCLLDKGPCTAEGKELKKYVPDALETECSKCSPKQKEIAGKVFSELLAFHRPYWDQLTAKYDPNHVFRTKYESQLGEEEYSDYEDARR